MKRIALSITLAALLVPVLTGYAQDTPKAPYHVQAFVTPEGKVHVIVDNPLQLRYKVELTDQRRQTLFEEYTNLPAYRRRLDVSGISGKGCEVTIRIGDRRFRYQVHRREANAAFFLDPPSTPGRRPAIPKDDALYTLQTSVEKDRPENGR